MKNCKGNCDMVTTTPTINIQDITAKGLKSASLGDEVEISAVGKIKSLNDYNGKKSATLEIVELKLNGVDASDREEADKIDADLPTYKEIKKLKERVKSKNG